MKWLSVPVRQTCTLYTMHAIDIRLSFLSVPLLLVTSISEFCVDVVYHLLFQAFSWVLLFVLFSSSIYNRLYFLDIPRENSTRTTELLVRLHLLASSWPIFGYSIRQIIHPICPICHSIMINLPNNLWMPSPFGIQNISAHGANIFRLKCWIPGKVWHGNYLLPIITTQIIAYSIHRRDIAAQFNHLHEAHETLVKKCFSSWMIVKWAPLEHNRRSLLAMVIATIVVN